MSSPNQAPLPRYKLSEVELSQVEETHVCNLSGRELTALPLEITQLTNLQTLDLSRNRLTTLPPEIGQLTNLRSLNISSNHLTALPLEITQLTNLQTLDLSRNRLTTLPPEIALLANLQRLEVSSSHLIMLPPEIGQLTKLRTLRVSHNQLISLPPEIGQLTNLDSLNIDSNQLISLPPEIGQLRNVYLLSLDGNQLPTVPVEVTQLTRLNTLLLDNNQLAELPPEIGRLTNLEMLRLNHNRLTKLPPEFTRLKMLNTLLIGRNQLTTLPPEITRLTNLRTLGLSANNLTALSPDIDQLTNLRALWVDYNQLTALPMQLADLLTKGLELKLIGNPLEGGLHELFERGTEELVAYLRSLGDVATPHYEAKVLLVGEGNVGKTSLIAALRGEPFVENRPTTHGIEIKTLPLRHPNLDVDMTVRAWDFGGQEVYRITHQFFFSQRALYLVVWKPREGQEQNEVEGWLRRVRLRVTQDVRALVVATHCSGESHPELDYPHLKSTFPELVGHFEVDSCTGRGLSELRQAIATDVGLLPHMGQLLSPSWIAARDELLSLAETEPQISFERFENICRGRGVEGDAILALASLLHILGRVIYYGDDEGLRDFVILNPEWLTKAIGYVLADEPTRAAGGVLKHARLKEIWQDRADGPTYPAPYHPYFLRLMEKFDVSYRLEDDEYSSLIGQLITHERPALPWDSQMQPFEGTRRLAMVCQLSESVPGLMAWLTVRHHRASIGKHWRSGVFLRHPIPAYASEALLELRTPTQLAVEVRAPSPDYFFNVLRDSIEDLMTRRWPGLSYELLIPCPSFMASGSQCPSLISMDGLRAYREEGETYYRCMYCRSKHDLSALLTGFAHPGTALHSELDRLQEELIGIKSGFTNLSSHAADTADTVRRVLQAVTTEITDCPRLFTLTLENPTGIRRMRRDQSHYRLVLWCEHPGHLHPWPPATYFIDQPKEWLLRIAPYLTLAFKTLQLIAPISAAVAGVVLTPDQMQHAQSEMQLMTTLVAALPDQELEDQPDIAVLSPDGTAKLTLAQGQAWRAIRALLLDHDPMRAFGDLRRVPAPSGEFVWVCPEHYTDYDPGLPYIPDR